MAVVFFNHHTLFPLANVLTRDNWRQIILPDFLCVYIFLCLSPKLSVSWTILRTLLVYHWYVWAVSAFFVSDYYPDHKKAPALIVIATYTVLTLLFLGFCMFLCWSMQCWGLPCVLICFCFDWHSSLHLLDMGKGSSMLSYSESWHQVVMESLVSEVALLNILLILYSLVLVLWIYLLSCPSLFHLPE